MIHKGRVFGPGLFRVFGQDAGVLALVSPHHHKGRKGAKVPKRGERLLLSIDELFITLPCGKGENLCTFAVFAIWVIGMPSLHAAIVV